METNINIPQGYKQTELGIIPEDWEVTTIKQIADITTGNKNTQDAEDGGKYPFYVRSQNVERINSYSYDSEGVVTAGDGVGTGKIFHYARGKFGLHQRAYLIYNFKDFDSQYFYWYFSQYFYDRINQMTAKSSVDSVRKEMIEDMCILRAPIAEQRAIAEALSDVDGLIAALDKKIAKKRLLKQGAMCKLLSLSGRGKKWFNTKLGNVVNIRKGSMLTSDKFVAGNIPVIAGGKIPAGYHNVANRPAKTITISASGASAGYVALYNKPIFATDCSTIEPCSTYNIHYIYHLLKYYQSEIFAMQTGGAQPHVHPSDLNELQILYAKDIEEQQAIATILSDMDKEIADLEAQRDKYRLLKSGMMQKLLTGQIRLKRE